MRYLQNGQTLANNNRRYYADGVIVSDNLYHQTVFEGWHAHENAHLTFLVNGGTVEDRGNTQVVNEPGNIVTYQAGERHRNRHTVHPSRNINIELEQSFFDTYDIDATLLEKLKDSHPSAALTVTSVLHEVMFAGDADRIHSAMLELLTATSKPTTCNTPLWVSKVKQQLHDCWNENVSLKHLAKNCDVHPVTISKYFSAYFGCTMLEYVRKLRVQKSLLMITDKRSLTDVAYECGFFDQSHFIHAFKAETGFLPREWKQMR